MIEGTGICPYSGHSPELRKKWHQERGVEDPLLKVVRKKPMEDPVPYKPSKSLTTSAPVEQVPINPGHTYGSTQESTREEKERARLAAYRAANKEKLAAKARERRAKK